LVLVGRANGTFAITNPTKQDLTVSVATADFELRPSGKAVVGPKLPPVRSAKSWLTVSPGTLRLAPAATATVRIASHPIAGASPGDHHALVLFTTVTPTTAAVSTRTQIGLPVLVRISGSIVRRLAVRSLTVKRGALRLELRNSGNITERLLRRSVTVRLLRRGRTAATLTAPVRSILPGGRTVYTLRAPRRLRGAFTAQVLVRPGTPEAEGALAPPYAPIVKRFRISL
jgi:hypothetical protein